MSASPPTGRTSSTPSRTTRRAAPLPLPAGKTTSAGSGGLVIDLAAKFAKWIGGKAREKAVGAVLAHLGLARKPPDQLAAISTQLTLANSRLLSLQRTVQEIRGSVIQVRFTQLMLKFKRRKDDVDEINRLMGPLALALDRLAQVKSSGADTKEIEKAEKDLKAQKKLFVELAGNHDVLGNVSGIGRLLESSAGEDDLVSVYGLVLTESNRYLTRRHSELLRAFYDHVEQYQVIAAIQRAEWQLARGVTPSDTASFDQLIKAQRAAFPDFIPAGAMIDAGPDTTAILEKPMLFPFGGSDGNRRTTWREEDPQRWSTGPGEAVRIASAFVLPSGKRAKPRKLKGWRVITAEEWNTLMSGKPRNKSGAQHLNDAFGLIAPPGERVPEVAYAYRAESAVWLAEPRLHRIRSTGYGWGWDFPVHAGMQVGRSGALKFPGPAVVWTPWLPDHGNANDRRRENELRQAVARHFGNGWGSLILSRTNDVDYMAMRPRPRR